MWGAAGVALVAIVIAVMSFVSRGKALKKNGELEESVDALEDMVASLLEEIEALALGDHGLGHDDMLGILLPGAFHDDSVDDS